LTAALHFAPQLEIERAPKCRLDLEHPRGRQRPRVAVVVAPRFRGEKNVNVAIWVSEFGERR
jgi:hypothetical protein